MNDTTVRCRDCGRTEDIRFAACLATGWPRCCGQTMELRSTSADIDAAVQERVDPAVRAAELVRRARAGAV